MNQSQYTVAAFMMFVRDTAVEGGVPPRRKQIEIDAAIKNMGLEPSELSFQEKQEAFSDLAELRLIHSEGEKWYLSPEIADWLKLPDGPAE